jgi:DNA replication and repair protein RecF
MTGTDEVLFDGFGDRAQFFRVADATIAPASDIMPRPPQGV